MFNSLGSLTAVMTILKPFESVPQPSVTYFRVMKFVRVYKAPTDCFVFRHVKSAWKGKREGVEEEELERNDFEMKRSVIIIIKDFQS